MLFCVKYMSVVLCRNMFASEEYICRTRKVELSWKCIFKCICCRENVELYYRENVELYCRENVELYWREM
jgi:hypothetical protein